MKYKRRYKKKANGGLKKIVKKLVKKVAGMDKADDFHKTYSQNESNIANQTSFASGNSLLGASMFDITNVAIGNDYNNRSGNAIHVKKIIIRGKVNPINTYVLSNYPVLTVKLLLVKIKAMADGGASGQSSYPTYEDLYNQNAIGAMLPHDFYNTLNLENRNSVIVWQKNMSVPRFNDTAGKAAVFNCSYRPPTNEVTTFNNATGTTAGSYLYVNKNCYVFIALTDRPIGAGDAYVMNLTAMAQVEYSE